MAFQPGHGAYLSIDSVDISAYTDTESLDRVSETLEVTNFGSAGNREYISGLRGHAISIGGSWDPALDAVMEAADDGAVVPFVFGPEGNASGDVQRTGNALIGNYSHGSAVEDKTVWTATFQPTGVVTRATV